VDRDGCITAYEIYRFMKETLYMSISLTEAELLIKEYDGNFDRRLSSQEFF
jgi:Ca2+-binding EF-hand superfamily protein